MDFASQEFHQLRNFGKNLKDFCILISDLERLCQEFDEEDRKKQVKAQKKREKKKKQKEKLIQDQNSISSRSSEVENSPPPNDLDQKVQAWMDSGLPRMDQGLTRMDPGLNSRKKPSTTNMSLRKKSSQSSSLSEDENSVSSSNEKNVLIKKGVTSKR